MTSFQYAQRDFNIDFNNRSAFNSVFGDRLIGIRKPSFVEQFQYPPASDASDNTIVGSGSITVVDSMLHLSTGTDNNGAVIAQGTRYLQYLPGHEAYCFFTAVYTEGVINSQQYAGLYDDNDGFYIGYSGVNFVIGRRRGGVDYQQIVDLTKVLPSGDFDPRKGNVYNISFGYLGFATINFAVLDPSGVWRNLGIIPYPNTETITHILQTNLPLRAEVVNTGNTSDIVFKTASFTAGIVDGAGTTPRKRRFNHQIIPTFSAGNLRIIAYRNKTTFYGLENRVSIILDLISFATSLSKISSVYILKNPPTTGGTWADINTLDSIMEYSTDITVTDFTGNTFLNWVMAKEDRLFENIREQNIELTPGDIAIFAITTPGGTSGEINLALRWSELF